MYSQFSFAFTLKTMFLGFWTITCFLVFRFRTIQWNIRLVPHQQSAIEVQLMRRFSQEQSARQLELPSEIIKYLCTDTNQKAPSCDAACVFQAFSLGLEPLNNAQFFHKAESSVIYPVSPCRKKMLSTDLLAKYKYLGYNGLLASIWGLHLYL